MNEIKEGDMVEYKHPAKSPFRTFGLVEKTTKLSVMVQWLWTEYKGKKGRMAPKEKQPKQDKLYSYPKSPIPKRNKLRVVA